jgi:hypothetical protein
VPYAPEARIQGAVLKNSRQRRRKIERKMLKLLLVVAILVPGVGRAFGQAGLTCNHKEPQTDYPDGDYMTSTSSDPCGSGPVTLLSWQDGNRLLMNSGQSEESVFRAGELSGSIRLASPKKEIIKFNLPTLPFLITSNKLSLGRNEG